MRKGKLGLVLCLYPILAFACVIVSQPLLCALIFAFVLLAERDEWTGRQTLQALILSAVTALVRELLVYGASLFPPIPAFSRWFPWRWAPFPRWFTWLPSS